MRYISIFIISLVFTCVFHIPSVEADTRYVGDQLIITLRQGKTTKHKILKTLKTGTPVEVLEEDSSYLKVRTIDGTEGYVLRQYISSSPPMTHKVEELELENSGLQKKINELQKENSSLRIQVQNTQEKFDREITATNAKSTDIEQKLTQAQENEHLARESYEKLLSQSENVVKIAKERDILLKENKKIAASLKELREKKEKMADTRMIKWFLAGGGVFFFGWMIGKISRKKRSRF